MNILRNRTIIIAIVSVVLLLLLWLGYILIAGYFQEDEDPKKTSKLYNYDYEDWKKLSDEQMRKLVLEYLDLFGEDIGKEQGPWHNDVSWLIEHTDSYYESHDKDDKVVKAMDEEIRVYNEKVSAERTKKIKKGYKAIKKGLSVDQVIKLMGEPDEKTFERRDGQLHEVLVYVDTIVVLRDKVVEKKKN